MLRRGLAVVGLLLVSLCVNAQSVYYPDALWQRKTPAEAGINAALLKGAIDFAVASESRNPRDLTLNHYQTFGREPFGSAIGPIKDRGDQTGVVVYKGYLVAEWGEPSRVDMTHSVTKSLLSSVVGVAYDRGMIRRLEHLALVRLRELVDRARRQPGAVGVGRRPLGRRHVHQRLRHGALRLSHSAPRQVEGPPASLDPMGRLGANADAGRARLRLHELVQQPRPQAFSERAGKRLRAYRQRHQHRVRRPGP